MAVGVRRNVAFPPQSARSLTSKNLSIVGKTKKAAERVIARLGPEKIAEGVMFVMMATGAAVIWYASDLAKSQQDAGIIGYCVGLVGSYATFRTGQKVVTYLKKIRRERTRRLSQEEIRAVRLRRFSG